MYRGDRCLLPGVLLRHAGTQVKQERPTPEVQTYRLPRAVETHTGVEAGGVQGGADAGKRRAQKLPVVRQKCLLHGERTTEERSTGGFNVGENSTEACS